MTVFLLYYLLPYISVIECTTMLPDGRSLQYIIVKTINRRQLVSFSHSIKTITARPATNIGVNDMITTVLL